MGEQVPVKDELERALASMRAGFLSGSTHIATGVASLEEHLAEAPFDEREKVGAAVAQIVATQERLIAQIERLPASSWDRFKGMVGILKAQQAILDDLGMLVKEHVLPRQLEGLSVAAASAAAPPPAPPSRPAPPPRRRLAADDAGPPDRERRGGGFKGLAAMIVAAIVLSLIPRETKLQDMAAKLVALVGSGGEAAPAGVSGAGTGAEPPKAASPAPRVPQDPEDTSATDKPAPSPPAGKRESAPKGPAVATAHDAAKPPAAGRPEQFVPVVFTHREQATVLKTLTDLQQQYPELLMDRKGEVQPVDLGKKGIWHRLVLLPAGSRPEATKLCDRLMVEGYDRCWVKAY